MECAVDLPIDSLTHYVHMLIMAAIEIHKQGEMITMGGHGHRNMYYATGLPGWMRFGYSPGWGGLPPGAQYLQQTGQTGQFADWLGVPAGMQGGWPMPAQSTEQQLEALNSQKEALEQQLEALTKRLEELEKEG